MDATNIRIEYANKAFTFASLRTDITGKQLKEKIQNSVGFYPTKLLVSGTYRQIEDYETLADCDIAPNDTIMAVAPTSLSISNNNNNNDDDAFFGIQRTSIRATGTSVTIPWDGIAKLMYYLSCVDSCVEDLIPSELTNYSNYSRLSEEEKILVVTMAILVSPDLLVGKVFFPVNAGSDVLNGTSNEFYEISQAKQLIGLVKLSTIASLVVDGKSVSVMKIMCLTQGWLMANYVEPLKAELWRVEAMLRDSEKKKIRKGLKLASVAQSAYDEALRIPDHSGFLQKKGGFIPNWKKRWFVLKNQYLYYSKDKQSNPQGVINLKNSCVLYDRSNPKYFSVKTSTSVSMDGKFSNRTYHFYADSSRDTSEWVLAITNAANRVSGWGVVEDVSGLPEVF
mmetsp:Transcript_3898/g.5462  ORF Transcript_3898/g.5462 Transcript_3898/m.5462 type:complete len:395 (-) Transcript_3898:17-1201(-)